MHYRGNCVSISLKSRCNQPVNSAEPSVISLSTQVVIAILGSAAALLGARRGEDRSALAGLAHVTPDARDLAAACGRHPTRRSVPARSYQTLDYPRAVQAAYSGGAARGWRDWRRMVT